MLILWIIIPVLVLSFLVFLSVQIVRSVGTDIQELLESLEDLDTQKKQIDCLKNEQSSEEQTMAHIPYYGEEEAKKINKPIDTNK